MEIVHYPVAIEKRYLGYYFAELKLRDDEEDLWLEIRDWFRLSRKKNISSDVYKIDCGRFKGIFPFGVFVPKCPFFCIGRYSKKSWKDWFFTEEDF